jgi:hypothetical protein
LKTQFIKYLLIGLFLIFGSTKAYGQVPNLAFTALQGNAPTVLLAKGTNYIVYGFRMDISGVVNYPVNYMTITQFTITNSVNVNGVFSSGQLYQTTSANPGSALSGNPVGTFNVGQNIVISPTLNINSLGINNAGGQSAGGGTQGQLNNGAYYFYLAVNISNLQNTPPASVTLSLVNPPAVATYFNNSNNPSPTESTTNLSTPATFSFGQVYDWSGATDNKWNTAGNWKVNGNTSNVVPGNNDAAQIGVNAYTITTNQPTPMVASTIGTVIIGTNNTPTITLTSTLAILNGLILNAGSALIVTGNNTLTLSGISSTNTGSSLTIKSHSTLLHNGTFTFKGATINIVDGTFNNSGTVTVGSACIINLTSAVANITNTGSFTLQSNENGSATIAAITAGGSITGNISVQRYVTGGSATYRGYRAVSSPVSTAAGSGIYSINYLKSSMLLTGTKGAAGGFDKSGNPTLYLYRPNIAPVPNSLSQSNFRGISDISNSPGYSMDYDPGSFNIPAGNGVFFFFRGDRINNLANKYTSGTVAETVTLTATGVVNVGPVTVKQWFNPSSSFLDFTAVSGNSTVQGFALVGNPYPSSINWDTYSTTLSTAGIYAPNVSNVTYTYDPVSKNYSMYTAGTGGVGSIVKTNANIIASGQGFFVKAMAANSAQLVFNEAAKTNTQAQRTLNLFLGTPTGTAVSQYLRLTLAMDSINIDGAIIRFNNGAKSTYDEAKDATYLVGNGLVSLSSMSADSIPLGIYTLALPKQTAATIGLNINAVNSGAYQLSLTARKSIPELFDLWLMDAYAKDSTDLRHTPSYSFSILKSDPASYGSKRFSLIIRKNPTLGVQLLSFNATKAGTGASVVWKTLHEQNYTNFTIERSLNDGRTFDVIGSVASRGLGTYSFLDKAPANGADKYRLKLEDLNGTVIYSNIVTLNYTNLGDNFVNISIYPNPVAATINLQIISTGNNSPTVLAGSFVTAAAQKPLYGIKIINITGSTVKTAISSEAAWHTDVSTLLPGTYIIQVTNNNDNSLVGKGTFIKL